MLAILILVAYAMIVVALVAWQISNLLSAWYGAPPISSPRHELWRDYADADKTFLDLGCGSGTLCLRAAPHFRHVYGMERSPFYYVVSWLRSWRYKNITIIYGNMLTRPWPVTDYIYCYLMPELLGQLRPKLQQSKAVILSYAFPIPQLKPSKVIKQQGKQLFVYRFEGRDAWQK